MLMLTPRRHYTLPLPETALHTWRHNRATMSALRAIATMPLPRTLRRAAPACRRHAAFSLDACFAAACLLPLCC